MTPSTNVLPSPLNPVCVVKKMLKDHDERLGEHASSIQLLKSMGQQEDGKPGFLDALETMIENLKKEIYARFASKDEVEDLSKRVTALEQEMKVKEKEMADMDVRLIQCRDVADTNRLDIEELKRQMKDLRKRVLGLNSNLNSQANLL